MKLYVDVVLEGVSRRRERDAAFRTWEVIYVVLFWQPIRESLLVEKVEDKCEEEKGDEE